MGYWSAALTDNHDPQIRMNTGLRPATRHRSNGEKRGFWRGNRQETPAPSASGTQQDCHKPRQYWRLWQRKKKPVPLSISWHGIKHKVAKNYRTHDHKQPEKQPTDASSSRPRQPEKRILAKKHEIKQFVAKKNLLETQAFFAVFGTRWHEAPLPKVSRRAVFPILGTPEARHRGERNAAARLSGHQGRAKRIDAPHPGRLEVFRVARNDG